MPTWYDNPWTPARREAYNRAFVEAANRIGKAMIARGFDPTCRKFEPTLRKKVEREIGQSFRYG